jgi:Zinc-binding dehydrogenase
MERRMADERYDVDLDYSYPSTLPHWRIQERKIGTLARRRIFSLKYVQYLSIYPTPLPSFPLTLQKVSGIQLAKAAGASKIFVTVGSQDKIDFCTKELGADQGFNYKTTDWSAEILKATNGAGVDIVIDFVGQNYFQGNLDVAARDARIVSLGALSGTELPAKVNIGAFVRKRIRFEGSSLRSRDEEYQVSLSPNSLNSYLHHPFHPLNSVFKPNHNESY